MIDLSTGYWGIINLIKNSRRVTMIGVEMDMVVTDSLKALSEYEEVFEVERIEVTDFPRGLNEAVFTIYGTRFHLLDENPDYFLIAPGEDSNHSFWFNVLVENLDEVFNLAKEKGWKYSKKLQN